MWKVLIGTVLVLSLFGIASCTEKAEGPMDFSGFDPKREIATDVDLTYSDSAVTQFRILAPRRESFVEEKKYVEEYPDGLYIEFYDREKEVISSIRAKYARRISEDGEMLLRDSVVLTNYLGDKLTTRGITWDELNQSLYTSKFVQLIKVEAQDTFYGFGFNAKDDFSEFNITQMTGKRRYQNFNQDLNSTESP